jgi:LPS export ABC transporter permease LptG/LPS export ABC transporter permease LptF
LPGVFTFTLPIAVLVGVLIGLGRMSADSEIIALHALGFGQRRLFLPIGLFALLAALLTAVMTFWLGPQALASFRNTEVRLRSTQASFEVQPRVFDERFPRLVLFVRDVDATATHWQGVLLAESGAENGPRLTLAEEAIVVADREEGKLQVHLRNGSSHEYDPKQPGRYSVTTFGQSDIPIVVFGLATSITARRSVAEFSLGELRQVTSPPQATRDAAVELHRRFSFPVTCLVFALLAAPLASRPRRGGRAGAFLLTLLVICGYYLIFVLGAGMARQGSVSPVVGIWGANVLAAVLGVFLFPRMEQPGEGVLARWAESFAELKHGWQRRPAVSERLAADKAAAEARAAASAASSHTAPAGDAASAPHLRAKDQLPPRLPSGPALLLDIYVLRHFCSSFLLMLLGFLLLFHAFTFFELLNDIARHNIPFLVVFDYFRYLTPFLCYTLLPLAALVAGVTTFSVLGRTNELTAFKAAGVSLYRLANPLLIAALVLSVAMILLDDFYLPYTNQRQDALRNQIKGRPAKTFFQPRRQWIFGEGSQLYNYELFDPDARTFGGLTVLILDPQTFQMQRRYFAARAKWDAEKNRWALEDGWMREFSGSNITMYGSFKYLLPEELREPPSYFNREVRQSFQMSWRELRNYINDLKNAGFDVARLSVQWHRKLAYPLMAPIILLLGVPFAVRLGARGTVMGVALAVGIGIVYWATYSLFEAMGAVGQLPPFVAAWAPDTIFALIGAYLYFKMPT